MATKVKGNILQKEIQNYLGSWRKERKDLLYQLVIGIIESETAVIWKVAERLRKRGVKVESRYKQITRFLDCKDLDWSGWNELILKLLGVKEKLTLLVDRTDWKSGSKHFNLLVFSVLTPCGSIPIAVKDLDKMGNSSSAERIELLKEVGDKIGWNRIGWVLADREFIGQEWWGFMRKRNVHLCIRIRESTRIGQLKEVISAKHVQQIRDLQLNESVVLPGKQVVHGQKVKTIALKILNDKGKEEYVIIASSKSAKDALDRYRCRWNIENMFKHCKTDGFNLENIQLRKSHKIEALFRVLGLAYLITLETGVLMEKIGVVKILKHGYRAKSIFRKGIQALQQILQDGEISLNQLMLHLFTTQRRRDFRHFIKNYCPIVREFSIELLHLYRISDRYYIYLYTFNDNLYSLKI